VTDIRDDERRIEDMLVSALNEYDANRDRSQQSKRGGLGMSSLGFCRNHAVLTLRQTPHDEPDVPPEGIEIGTWPAQVGSAIHEWIDHALADKDALLGYQIGPVTATFPQSGTTVSGIPDIFLPGENALIDVKTKNRLEYVKRSGPDQNMVFQRHAYAMGLIDAGIARDDGTLLVGNAFFDRSGVDKRPYVVLSSFDPTLTPQIDMWIEDILYAYEHNEPAPQDKPYDFCERFCEFFTTCRGVMEDTHDPTLILDDEVVSAVGMYAEGQALAREARRLQDIAKPLLADANGRAVVDGVSYQVRHVQVQASEFKRAAHSRLDVKKMRA
jgi:hypothetical protein